MSDISLNQYRQMLMLQKQQKGAGGPFRFAADACLGSSLIEQSFKKQSFLFFTTGLGLSKCGQVPVRLPALIVPALQVMEKFKVSDLAVPQYLIYQATNFIAETNEIDQEVAMNASLQIKTYLKAYVAEFHPDLIPYVHFQFHQ